MLHCESEAILDGSKLLCLIIRAEPTPGRTTFYTSPDSNLQVGKIVYPRGGEIPRHTHRQVTRTVCETSEVLVVQKGRMIIDVYDDSYALVESREMARGDVVILLAGGHGFRLLEDTVLLEVKQGPYSGLQEKDRF
jgi:quercetin dioxygenase-like cupin family protein